MANFPDMGFDESVIDYYNERTRSEYIRVRDFLVLHYKASTRDDTPFWRHVQSLPVSNKLKQKMDVYKATGRVFREDNELFNETSWLAVMHGQKLKPKSYHPVVHVLSDEEIKQRLEEI